jgi:hypothetical protein
MKTKLNFLFITLALLALSSLNSQLSTAHAQGTTAFTYQGHPCLSVVVIQMLPDRGIFCRVSIAAF